MCALGVNAEAPGHIELPVAAAVAAEPAQVLAVAGEPLDPVVHAVHDNRAAVGVEGDARRAVELPLIAARLAPTRHKRAVRVEDRDAVQEIVGGEDVVVAVEGDGTGPDELPVATPEGPELPEELVVQGDPADALPQLLSAPADNVNYSVGCQGHVLRRPEPLPRHTVHSQAEAVIKHPACGHCRQHNSTPNLIRREIRSW